jgi:hypothetical protein
VNASFGCTSLRRLIVPLPVMLVSSAAALASCRPIQAASVAGDSTGAAVASAPNEVTVHARDFAFDAPDEVPAGPTTFHLVNDGPGIHHMVIMRLDSGKTFADLQQAFQNPGPPPRWGVVVGGPDAPGPHAESNATVDLAPGNYALVCFVDVPGGVPHVAKGMLRALTVAPSSGLAAAPPKPDVTVAMSDYTFDLSGPLTSGHRVFLVRGLPGQPHELELFRLTRGKTATDMVNWVRNMKGPPPGQPLGGAAPVAAGTPVYFSVDLTPGTYVMVCFMPDATDGKPHFVHGMSKTIEVT